MAWTSADLYFAKKREIWLELLEAYLSYRRRFIESSCCYGFCKSWFSLFCSFASSNGWRRLSFLVLSIHKSISLWSCTWYIDTVISIGLLCYVINRVLNMLVQSHYYFMVSAMISRHFLCGLWHVRSTRNDTPVNDAFPSNSVKYIFNTI